MQIKLKSFLKIAFYVKNQLERIQKPTLEQQKGLGRPLVSMQIPFTNPENVFCLSENFVITGNRSKQ